MKRTKTYSKESPKVGIFWFYHGKIIFKNAVPLNQGINYGTTIICEIDHESFWNRLEQSGQLKNLPPHLRFEYFALPRGIVVFHPETEQYFVIHGNNLAKKELNLVAKEFNLPKEKTTFEQDILCCDLSDEEWEAL